MAELKFFPAWGGPWSLSDLYYKGYDYDLAWWTERSIIKHPYIMVSYGSMKFTGRVGLDDWRETYHAQKAKVYTDSGGLQKYTLGMDVNPDNSFNWQERNGDVMFVLDMPPLGVAEGKVEFDRFKKAAEITAENNSYLSKKFLETKNKVYGILHGTNLKELDTWWDTAIQPFLNCFDGVGFGVRPSNDLKLEALIVCYLHNKGIKNIHALAIGGMGLLAVLVEAQDLFDSVSSDSSGIALEPGYGKILSPINSKQVEGGRKAEKKGAIDYVKTSGVFCPCRICEYGRKVGVEAFDLNSITSYIFASLHNLGIVLTYHKLLLFVKSRGLALEDYFDFSDKGLEALNLIREYKEKGWESISKKYRPRGLMEW